MSEMRSETFQKTHAHTFSLALTHTPTNLDSYTLSFFQTHFSGWDGPAGGSSSLVKGRLPLKQLNPNQKGATQKSCITSDMRRVCTPAAPHGGGR